MLPFVLFFSSESESVPFFPSIILYAQKHLDIFPKIIYANKIRQGLILRLLGSRDP